MRIAAQRSINPAPAVPLEQNTQRTSSSFLELLASITAPPAPSGKGTAAPSRFSLPTNSDESKNNDGSANNSANNDPAQKSTSNLQPIAGSALRHRISAAPMSLPLLLLQPLRSSATVASRAAIRDDKPQLSASALAAKIAASVVLPFTGAVASASPAAPADQTVLVPVSQASATPVQLALVAPPAQPPSLSAQQVAAIPVLLASPLSNSESAGIRIPQPASIPIQQTLAIPVSRTSTPAASQAASIPASQPLSISARQSSSSPLPQLAGIHIPQPSTIPAAQSAATPAAQSFATPAQQSFAIPVSQTPAYPASQSASIPAAPPSPVPAQQSSIISDSQAYTGPSQELDAVRVPQSSTGSTQQSPAIPASQPNTAAAPQAASTPAPQPLPSGQAQEQQSAPANTTAATPAIDPSPSPVAVSLFELVSARTIQPAPAARIESPVRQDSDTPAAQPAINFSLPVANSNGNSSFSIATVANRIPAPAAKPESATAAPAAKPVPRAIAPATASANQPPEFELDTPAQRNQNVSLDQAVTATAALPTSSDVAASAPATNFILPQLVLTPSVADALQPAVKSTQSSKTPDQFPAAATSAASSTSAAKPGNNAPASPAATTRSSTVNNQPDNHTPADSQQSAPVALKSADATPAHVDPTQPQSVAIPASAHDTTPHTRAADASEPVRANTQPAPSADASASGSINTARLLQTMSESEMRVGMHSAEFGDISIRTMVSPQQMTTQISVDHGDLGKAISAHIPSIQEKLGGELGLKALVEVSHSGMSFAGDRGYSAPREQRPYAPSTPTDNAIQPAEIDPPATKNSAIPSIDGYRLDIRA